MNKGCLALLAGQRSRLLRSKSASVSLTVPYSVEPHSTGNSQSLLAPFRTEPCMRVRNCETPTLIFLSLEREAAT